MNKAMKLFIGAIVVMGVVRFVLSLSGLPNEVVKYFSMSAVIMAGTIYFAIASSSHKERLKDAYLLIAPYLVIEVITLSYTWISGRQTIFHAAEYSFGTSIRAHTIGHLVGGLTWEPLSLFVVMEVIWLIYTGARALVRKGRHADA